MRNLPREAYDVIEGRHSDPFHYLGLHRENGRPVLRVFLPEASEVAALDHGQAALLPRIHESGLFAGPVAENLKSYRLRARFGNDLVEMEDAYRFPPLLSDFDLHLLGEGNHLKLYDK